MRSYILALLLLTGCAAAPLNDQERTVVSRAIDQNDTTKLRSYLTRDIATGNCSLLQKLSSDQSCRHDDACSLLTYTLSKKDGVCRTDIVQFLIEKGLNVSHCTNPGIELRTAAEQLCPDIVQLITPHLSPESLSSAISAFNVRPPVIPDKRKISEPRWNLVLQSLRASISPSCSKDGEGSRPCEALLHLDSLESKFKASVEQYEGQIAAEKANEQRQIAYQESLKAEEDAKERDPRRIAIRACSASRGIARFKSMIAQERQIGERSGYENKKSLYSLGAMQLNDEGILEKERKHYKTVTGKSLDMSICKSLPETEEE